MGIEGIKKVSEETGLSFGVGAVLNLGHAVREEEAWLANTLVYMLGG